MNKLISAMAVTASYADYLLGALLCALGFHDCRKVFPRLGIYSRYEECARPGCDEKRNFIRRAK